MNLQSIIITDAMGTIILVVLLISSHLVRQRRQPSDNVFSAMCAAAIICCAADAGSFAVDGQTYDGAKTAGYFLNNVTYIGNILVSFMWFLYVDLRLYNSVKSSVAKMKRLCAPAVLALTGIVINTFFHFVYYIDGDNVYHRMTPAIFYFFITYFYLFGSVVNKIVYRKKIGNPRFLPLWMFLVPIILCATLQFIYYGVSLGWCSVSIGLAGMHMALQNELAYIDPLTRLYNRNYLDHTIRSVEASRGEMRGIMIDMDRFKEINDVYGHSVGDEALVETAKLLSRAVPPKAIPIRFAGDEFIVLLPRATEEELVKTIEAVRREEKAFNEAGRKPYKLMFSLGSSAFSSDDDADRFLNEMDRKMYEEKRSKDGRGAVSPSVKAAFDILAAK